MGHNEQPDYYEILGVAPQATAEEITRAFRKAMRAVHPDASGTSGLFRLVKTAYDTLKDPVSRAAYDARHKAESPPKPEPEPSPRPKTGRPKQPPGPGSKTASAGKPEAKPASPVTVRPRFGTFWIPVAGIAVCAVGCLAAVYALWPAGLPDSLFLLLLLSVVAAPIIALQPALRSLAWPWFACVVPFAGVAVLAASESGRGASWPLWVALTGLTLAGVGAAAAPYIVRRGQMLDQLVGRDSLDYQIFNVPGAGLGSRLAREVAQTSAGRLELLTHLEGVRIVHGLTPPQMPGQARYYVDHAVLRNNRLALVMTRRWPATVYAWSDKSTLTAGGQRFPGGDTGIATAVRAFRKVTPRRIEVRGFVAVLPDDPARAPWLDFAPSSGDLFAGTLAQVHEQIDGWLGETSPVVHRRLFAALLPHVRRS